ncbi:MAG: spore coat protein CotJB [Lachnospiraceae bacterium]|nr:spore coat protein CotJB [Lachnospiraceae bacterium]
MMCGCNKQQLWMVYQTGFALDDIKLYLDTHVDDQDAMNYYNYVRRAHRDAVRAYEQSCGPLTADQVTSENWNWVESPWPWEGGSR